MENNCSIYSIPNYNRAYLPSNGKNSSYEYSKYLEIVYDIIQNYQNIYEIIVGGDLDWSLLQSRLNKHDKLLKNLMVGYE